MKSFLLALQFLTRIPVRVSAVQAPDLGRSSAFFPVIGALLGIILACVDYALGLLGCDNLAASAVDVVLLVLLTGALHLDGLADTCDALQSGKDREGMLAVMRDPHTGAMGVAGIVSVIILKTALLGSLFGPFRIAALALMCVFGRWSMVCSMAMAPYARSDGKARAFIDGIGPRALLVAGALTAAFAASVWRLTGLVLFATVTGAAYLLTQCAKRRFGGITGDTLGATNECVEVFTILLVCVGQGY